MCTATYFDFIFLVLLLIAMFYNWRCMYVWHVQLNSTYLLLTDLGGDPDPPRGRGNVGGIFQPIVKYYGIYSVRLLFPTLFARWQ